MINKRKMITIRNTFLVISIVGPVLSSDLLSQEPRPTCEPGKFPCDKFRCIPDRWVCDRSPDCLDGTDELEENCPTGVTIKPIVCRSNQFQCHNGFCLPIKWKCDGTDDCGDGSDEIPEKCKHNCTANEFMCGDGQCIAAQWRCDGHEDCTSGSDEKNCTQITKNFDSTQSFKCVEGYAIPLRWRCDGDLDCRDGSDETDCEGYSKLSGEVEDTGTSHLSLDSFRTKCREDEFRCPGSYCILQSWVCDGVGDCRNSEDEVNCTNIAKCRDNEFKCADSSGCLQKYLVCDGVNNCLDNSDERNCSKAKPKQTDPLSKPIADEAVETTIQVNKTIPLVPKTPTEVATNATLKTLSTGDVTNTTLPKAEKTLSCNNATEFSCNDGKCISRSKLCNGDEDCRRGEDESEKECGTKDCERNNGGCMQQCIDTKEGHHCACANGYILVGRYSCADINECVEVPGICSQQCTNTEGSFHCSCLPGYTRDPGNFTRCKASEGEVYLLFSHSYDIRSIRLRDHDMTSVVQHTRSAIALDYMFDQGQILWSDKKDKKIYRANLANAENREVLVSDEDVSADGLAVDWIHSNVYYTDTEHSAIRVLTWDAKYVKTLINEEVGHPRAIVVSPHKGFIYWTDWGSNAKIERAALDGSDRQAIVSYPHVVWPNGLTIDHSTEKIFWCDGRLRTISSANLDGSNVEVILYSPVFLRQPFSISVFEDRLYWTDWSQVALFSADKFTGNNIQNVSAGHLLESPKVVHVYHQYRQPRTENICTEHSCSHFCMRSAVGKAFCACADGYTLDENNAGCIRTMVQAERISGGIPTPNVTEEKTAELRLQLTELKLEKLEINNVEKQSQIGFIVGGVIGAMFGVAIIIGVYFGYTKVRRQPIKRIRFNNPVYRKTTSDDDGRGYIIGQDQLFYNPTSNIDDSADSLTTDADDAPLTPKDDNDDIV